MERNPYAPPNTPLEDTAGAPRAAGARLYSPTQIGVATLIGGLIPPAFFAAANYRAFERPRAAVVAILLGLIGTVGVFVGSIYVVPTMPLRALTLGATALAFGLAQAKFGTTIAHHQDAGGELRSWWAVIGWSLLWGVVLGIIITFINHLLMRRGVLPG